MDLDSAAIVLAARELLPASDVDLSDALVKLGGPQGLLTPGEGDGREHALARYLLASGLDAGFTRWRSALETFAAENPGCAWTIVTDSSYPRALNKTRARPPLLFYRGQLDELARPSVAIVGSRTPSHTALTATEEIAHVFAAAGWMVTSGLALGIDSAAHQGALKRGWTTAVLPSGIDVISPIENRKLARRIISAGVLLSQFPPGAPATATSYLARNSVISGLSALSIVTSGTEHSGTANEVDHAVGQGRPVIFWESTMKYERWAQRLVEQGLGAFVGSIDDAVTLGSRAISSINDDS